MASPNFPSTGLVPNVTTFNVGDIQYLWDGEKWNSITADLSAGQISAEGGDTVQVNLNKHEALDVANLIANGYSGNYGFFEKGFNYLSNTDLGVSADGKLYKYVGSAGYPVHVIAGRDPLDHPTWYEEVKFNDAKGITTKTEGSIQDFVDSFALEIFQSPTDGLTKIKTRTLLGGEVFEVRKVSDDSLATVYSDKEGDNEIVQDGTSNISGNDGVVDFYIADGDYYVEVDSVKSNFGTDSNQIVREKTISQAIDEDADTGVIYNITDLKLARYEVVNASDSGGFYYSSMASGRKLRLAVDDNTVIENFGNPVNNDVVNSAALFVKTIKFSSNKVYSISNITLPDYVSVEAYDTTIFKKSSNGFIFDLGRQGTIKGGAKFDGSHGDLGFTGNSIVISRGDNSTTKENQGHQRVYNSSFTNSDSYHVIYPNANKGWMSALRDCKFLDKPANAAASVKWPDESTNGGNRQITGGYSAGPVCNVSGADNGVIALVECGAVSEGLSDQFVYFDDTATNLAKKIRVIGNRPAIANGFMNVKNAADCVFSSNVFAGGVIFESGSINCNYDESNSQSSFTDSSGETNTLTIPRPVFYTPTVSSGLTLGDGTLQGEYTRAGIYIDFRMELTIGSTTAITGTMVFSLPFSVNSGTRIFTGTAFGAGYAGLSYIRQVDNTVRVYSTGGTISTWNASNPKAWVNGDSIIIEGRYRI